jgi:hypothetical protein
MRRDGAPTITTPTLPVYVQLVAVLDTKSMRHDRSPRDRELTRLRLRPYE